MMTQSFLKAAAQHKLVNVVGRKLAPDYYLDVCSSIGISDVTTPDEALKFANALIDRGGLLASVGQSLATQAVMCGARQN